jgi:hypothetical protein
VCYVVCGVLEHHCTHPTMTAYSKEGVSLPSRTLTLTLFYSCTPTLATAVLLYYAV